MEQVVERTADGKYDWRTLEIFDEDGTQIKNPRTLRSIAEAMELGDAWEKRMESYHLEEIFGRYDEEDENVDTEEEDN
ncbi:MAG: hypothetical protein IJR63_10270 [Synergistaceae bacterium]|nr:hypothetical protein [Synergistaceae bacterium]